MKKSITCVVCPRGCIMTAEIAGDVITNSKLTPNSPEWGVAFGSTQLNEFFTRIAKGEDVETVAKSFDEQLSAALNK